MYDLLSPGFTGRCTAPLLVDRVARKAVCNESSILTRNLLALARPPPGAPPGTPAADLVPAALLAEIDAWNDKIYNGVNNGELRLQEGRPAAAATAAEELGGRQCEGPDLTSSTPHPTLMPCQECTSVGSAPSRRGSRPPSPHCSRPWTSWRRC